MTKIHEIRYDTFKRDTNNKIIIYTEDRRILTASENFSLRLDKRFSVNDLLLISVFSKIMWNNETANKIIRHKLKHSEIESKNQ